MKITDIDASTNTVIERDPTPEELNQMKLDLVEYQTAKKKEQEIQSSKESAKAKLAALGLTEDEVNGLIS